LAVDHETETTAAPACHNFRPGSAIDPARGAYSAAQDLLAGFRGKGRGGKEVTGKEGEKKEQRRRGKEKRGKDKERKREKGEERTTSSNFELAIGLNTNTQQLLQISSFPAISVVYLHAICIS